MQSRNSAGTSCRRCVNICPEGAIEMSNLQIKEAK
ncbi:4Fe-4S binding protein [Methanosarcina sp. Mfa9]